MSKEKQHSNRMAGLLATFCLVGILLGPLHGIWIKHPAKPHTKAGMVTTAFDHCPLCHFQTGGVVPVLRWADHAPELARLQWLMCQVSSPESITETSVYLRGPPIGI